MNDFSEKHPSYLFVPTLNKNIFADSGDAFVQSYREVCAEKNIILTFKDMFTYLKK